MAPLDGDNRRAGYREARLTGRAGRSSPGLARGVAIDRPAAG